MSVESNKGRVAVVTGAGSGIGRAAALALLADGWSVALAGRRLEPLEQVAEESGAAARAFAVPTDVANAESVQALFAAAVARFGRVDLLFNNAGVGNPPGPFEDWTPEQWKGVVDINLSGMFFCIQQAFRTMKAQTPRGGRIINNGSISAHTPRPYTAPYTASKHAVTGLTKALSLDGRAFNIVASQIDIGNALTELSERMTRGVLQANGTTAPEPMMDATHVANAVRHMAALPLDANVLTMTIMASAMPFTGRG